MKRALLFLFLVSSALAAGTPPAAFENWPVTGTPSSSTFLRGDGQWASTSGTVAAPLTLTIAGVSNAVITDALSLVNSTAATTTIRQQYSPDLRFKGSGWKTTATAGAMDTEWRIYNLVATDTTTPESYLFFDSQTNGGVAPGAAWATRMQIWDGEPGGFGAWLIVPNVKVSGTAGKGVLELATQSSAPSSPAANNSALYSNSAGHFVWKDSGGTIHDPQDAANITSGTIATARLGSGATSSNFLRGDSTWATPPGGGGGTPGGSNTQLQYNNSSAFGGVTTATYNGTTLTLINPTIGNSVTQGFQISNSLGQLSTITPSGTAGTFTFTLPNDNTTLVGTTEAATLSAKTIIDPVIGNTTTQGFRMRNAASNLDTILPHSGAGNPTLTMPSTTGTLALTSDNITGSAATLTTTRTIWGQNFNGSANVTGALTAVGDITGGANNMTITAGTGNSRTLTLNSTTSGGTATAFLTGNADQSSTFGGNISGTGAWTLTGGAGNMTITSGTGNSRTMALRTTTSGGTATTALTLNADQTATFAAGITSGGNAVLTSASTLNASNVTTGTLPAAQLSSNAKVRVISATLDGGGTALSFGKFKGFYTVPYSGTITGWSMSADSNSGTITVKVWKEAGATNSVPTAADSITTTGLQLTSSAIHGRSTGTPPSAITSGSTVSVGDVFAFNLESGGTGGATEISVQLEITTD